MAHIANYFLFFKPIGQCALLRNSVHLSPDIRKIRGSREVFRDGKVNIQKVVAAPTARSVAFNINSNFGIRAQVKVIAHENLAIDLVTVRAVNVPLHTTLPKAKAFSRAEDHVPHKRLQIGQPELS